MRPFPRSVAGCAVELKLVCVHRGPAGDAMCSETLGRKPVVNSPKSYPNQMHDGIVLAALSAMGFGLNKEKRKYIHDGFQVTQ